MTPCHTTESFLRNDSKHFKACNYSYWKHMMPWTCVKPGNKNLSCKDWKGYNRTWSTYLKELNECELRLAKRYINCCYKINYVFIFKVFATYSALEGHT